MKPSVVALGVIVLVGQVLSQEGNQEKKFTLLKNIYISWKITAHSEAQFW